MAAIHQEEQPVKVRVDYRRSTAEKKAKTASKRKNKAAETEKLRNDLAARLQHLRSIAHHVAQSYMGNLERNIVEIADNSPQKSRTVKSFIKMLQHLSVKPEKGRRKDLKKIEQTVNLMLASVQRKK